MINKHALIDIANTRMPFGKYQGRRLIDLPEYYLLWFARRQAFPPGKLGELLALTLVIKTENLSELIEPFRRSLTDKHGQE